MALTQKIFGLARPRPGVTWKDMLPLMQTEAAHVWSLYERDVVRDAWVRTDELGAVYVLEATAEDGARLLAQQPMARHGLVDFELVPVGPFTPLSLLFGTQPDPVLPVRSGRWGTRASARVLALDRLGCEASDDELARCLAEEAHHTWSLWKGGVIRENYLRTDRRGAALMLEVPGVREAHEVLARLPLVRAGLMEFECLSLAAFMGYDALLDGSLDEPPRPLPDPTESTGPLPRRRPPPVHHRPDDPGRAPSGAGLTDIRTTWSSP